MSRFDISNSTDFARLTLSGAGAILQDIASLGRNPSEWDVLEGSYNGVLFHVFRSKSEYQGALSQIQDVGGRRKVKYQFPYRDGQTTDDLGRRPGTFDMDILLHGNRYLTGLRQLLNEFNKPTPGDLIHPVRGPLKVVVEDVEVLHTSEKRKAAALRITFLEHNFTIGDIREVEDKSVKGFLSTALDFVETLESAILQVRGVLLFATSIRNRIEQEIDEYRTGYLDTLTNINVNLNTRGATDIPSILPVNMGGTAGETNILDTVSTAQSLGTDVQPVTPALAAEDIKKQVDSTRELAAIVLNDIAAQPDGPLLLYDEVQDIKESVIVLQRAFEAGVASSQAQVVRYQTPRLMSLREVAFSNGIEVNRVEELDLLNPELLSTNFIGKGTTVKVPIA